MADDESGTLEVESAESEPSLADDLRSEFQAAEPEGASDKRSSQGSSMSFSGSFWRTIFSLSLRPII